MPRIFIFCFTSKNSLSTLISAGKDLVLDLLNFIITDLSEFIIICRSEEKIFKLLMIFCNIFTSSESLVSNLSSKVKGLGLPISPTRSVSRLTLAATERSSMNFTLMATGSLVFFEKRGHDGLGMTGLRAALLKIEVLNYRHTSEFWFGKFGLHRTPPFAFTWYGDTQLVSADYRASGTF